MVARFAKALRITSDEILGLQKEDAETAALSLRFVKRVSVIETFPEAQKKRILRNLDDAIDSHVRKTESEPATADDDSTEQ